MNKAKFPGFETERLFLRAITEQDAPEVLLMRSDPDVMRHIPRPLCNSFEEAIKHIRSIRQSIARNEIINWGISCKKENKLIGIVGFYRMQPEHFRAEIGYLIDRQNQRKGYMQEIMPVLIRYGFEHLNLNSIEAVIDPDNVASENLLIKHHFKKEAHFRENYFFNGRFLDSVHYSLLKSDYHSINHS